MIHAVHSRFRSFSACAAGTGMIVWLVAAVPVFGAQKNPPVPRLIPKPLVYIQTDNLDRIVSVIRKKTAVGKQYNDPALMPIRKKIRALIAWSGRPVAELPPIPMTAYFLAYDTPRRIPPADPGAGSGEDRLFETIIVIGPCKDPTGVDGYAWIRVINQSGFSMMEKRMIGDWLVVADKKAPWSDWDAKTGPASWFGKPDPALMPPVPDAGFAFYADINALNRTMLGFRDYFLNKWMRNRLIGLNQKLTDLKITVDSAADLDQQRRYSFLPQSDFMHAKDVSQVAVGLHAIGEGNVTGSCRLNDAGQWSFSIQYHPRFPDTMCALPATIRPVQCHADSYLMAALSPNTLDILTRIRAASMSPAGQSTPAIRSLARAEIRNYLHNTFNTTHGKRLLALNGPVYVERRLVDVAGVPDSRVSLAITYVPGGDKPIETAVETLENITTLLKYDHDERRWWGGNATDFEEYDLFPGEQDSPVVVFKPILSYVSIMPAMWWQVTSRGMLATSSHAWMQAVQADKERIFNALYALKTPVAPPNADGLVLAARIGVQAPIQDRAFTWFRYFSWSMRKKIFSDSYRQITQIIWSWEMMPSYVLPRPVPYRNPLITTARTQSNAAQEKAILILTAVKIGGELFAETTGRLPVSVKELADLGLTPKVVDAAISSSGDTNTDWSYVLTPGDDDPGTLLFALPKDTSEKRAAGYRLTADLRLETTTGYTPRVDPDTFEWRPLSVSAGSRRSPNAPDTLDEEMLRQTIVDQFIDEQYYRLNAIKRPNAGAQPDVIAVYRHRGDIRIDIQTDFIHLDNLKKYFTLFFYISKKIGFDPVFRHAMIRELPVTLYYLQQTAFSQAKSGSASAYGKDISAFKSLPRNAYQNMVIKQIAAACGRTHADPPEKSYAGYRVGFVHAFKLPDGTSFAMNENEPEKDGYRKGFAIIIYPADPAGDINPPSYVVTHEGIIYEGRIGANPVDFIKNLDQLDLSDNTVWKPVNRVGRASPGSVQNYWW